ncbi:aminopeptidase P family protein [Mesorhizobium sp. B3-1-3]|uniref:M24 family metallopeptidase n=1 Tax=unclassified Mesorhizobium TaxID=325217 RepID=UPI00112EACD6|nr:MULTISPECIES: Xaa-Pro peptidase family protein [unclassified Mesorhizobium]TPI67153.1 aminopeptidase P family protein [Mesorhizobium sp. B3-1-8]TPI70383.1 aminopeptidase P family protein [Mesorhizobium sp. B3-1-3]
MLTAFSFATYRDRQKKLRARIKSKNLDALIVNFPDNINYLTGFDSLGFLWYQALIVSEKVQPALFFTRTSEMPCVHELSAIEDAVFYDIANQDPLELVAKALIDAGHGNGRIGIETHAFTFSPDQFLRLQNYLPDATLVDASTAVAEERLIKSPQEIEYQRSAARMADYAMKRAFAAIRPGRSEVEIAGEIAMALGEAGSEYSAISPMVATGRRSTMTHCMPQRQVVSVGDVVLIELAGVCNRYHSILMRTAVVGNPSARVREVSDLLTESFNAAMDAAKPGLPVGGTNTACNKVLNRMNLAKTRVHRIGYSLGLAYPPSWLEAMMLDEADDHVFEPNMSFSMEPNLSLYDEGFGLKLGDTVLCNEKGSASLSELPPTLTILD